VRRTKRSVFVSASVVCPSGGNPHTPHRTVEAVTVAGTMGTMLRAVHPSCISHACSDNHCGGWARACVGVYVGACVRARVGTWVGSTNRNFPRLHFAMLILVAEVGKDQNREL
jgi:hypothetical protein